jgi:hypothetical protein
LLQLNYVFSGYFPCISEAMEIILNISLAQVP